MKESFRESPCRFLQACWWQPHGYLSRPCTSAGGLVASIAVPGKRSTGTSLQMGTLRKDRLKMVEGGKIRYGRSTSGHAGVSLQTLADAEKGKHACKGQNECKGQGGCKTSDAGCKGKNSCKGKGGCATDGTKPLNFSNQAIAARLSEQLGPLCGVGVSTLRPHPKAEVTRSSY